MENQLRKSGTKLQSTSVMTSTWPLDACYWMDARGASVGVPETTVMHQDQTLKSTGSPGAVLPGKASATHVLATC